MYSRYTLTKEYCTMKRTTAAKRTSLPSGCRRYRANRVAVMPQMIRSMLTRQPVVPYAVSCSLQSQVATHQGVRYDMYNWFPVMFSKIHVLRLRPGQSKCRNVSGHRLGRPDLTTSGQVAGWVGKGRILGNQDLWLLHFLLGPY